MVIGLSQGRRQRNLNNWFLLNVTSGVDKLDFYGNTQQINTENNVCEHLLVSIVDAEVTQEIFNYWCILSVH